MAGNVWEWCHSVYMPYPYQAHDGRENPAGDDDWRVVRVVRGGSWLDYRADARCAYRAHFHPGYRYDYRGFRCLVSSVSRF